MKKAAFLTFLVLAACGAPPTGTTPEGEQDPTPAPMDPPPVATVVEPATPPPDAGHDAAPDAEADAAPEAEADAADAGSDADASTDPPDTGAAHAACVAMVCSNAEAKCGALAGATCDGEPVDCGTCSAGNYCNDNGRANQCGSFCLNQTHYLSGGLCAGFGFEPHWAVNFGCGVPYDDSGNQRAGGLTGCIYHDYGNGVALQCCP